MGITLDQWLPGATTASTPELERARRYWARRARIFGIAAIVWWPVVAAAPVDVWLALALTVPWLATCLATWACTQASSLIAGELAERTRAAE